MTKRIYPLSAFRKAQAPAAGAAGARAAAPAPPDAVRIADLTELATYNVPKRVLVIIAQGHHPDEVKHDNSRKGASQRGKGGP
jgi:hypothetical protein